MELKAKLEQKSVHPKDLQQNNLLIQLITPAIAESTRPPLVLGLCIDKSWSMKGDKMEATIEAATYLINWLTRNDYVSIVAYSSDVELIQHVTKLNNKQLVIDKLRSIHVGTTTNLSGGWLQSLRTVEDPPVKESYKRILLLTDGQATQGVKDPAQFVQIAKDHFSRGISTTTIGFGDDFNENVLKDIAMAGGGNFHYIANPEQAPDVFFKEFGDVGTLYGQSVEIKLKLEDGVKFTGLLSETSHTYEGKTVTIQAGDLRSDDVKNYLVSFETENIPSNLDHLFEVSASYYNLTNKMSYETVKADVKFNLSSATGERDREVVVETIIAKSAKSMLEASRFLGANNPQLASEVLQKAIQNVEINLHLSPEHLGPVSLRLKNLESKIQENAVNIGKQLTAGSSDLLFRRAMPLDLEGMNVHNQIFEFAASGDIDLYNCPDIKALIQKQMNDGFRFIIFDLTKTNHIDSSGIGALIQIEGWLRRRGGVLVVTGLHNNVLKIFSMTRLENHIKVSSSMISARNELEDYIKSIEL